MKAPINLGRLFMKKKESTSLVSLS